MYLDFSGMKCPKPMYEFQRALKDNPTCSEFEVLCTDKNTVEDFKSLVDFGIVTIESITESGSGYHFKISRAKG